MAWKMPMVAMVLLAGCRLAGSDEGSGEAGRALYARHCAQCHGTALRGDGPLAPELAVAPADLTTLSERNGGVFPHEEVIAMIHGYQGRHQLGLMPEFARDLPPGNSAWTAPDGTVHEVPTAILALARYLERRQR